MEELIFARSMLEFPCAFCSFGLGLEMEIQLQGELAFGFGIQRQIYSDRAHCTPLPPIIFFLAVGTPLPCSFFLKRNSCVISHRSPVAFFGLRHDSKLAFPARAAFATKKDVHSTFSGYVFLYVFSVSLSPICAPVLPSRFTSVPFVFLWPRILPHVECCIS